MAKDDYRPLAFYETNLGNIQDGFGKFSAEGEHYFTYNVGNQVYLISEGYASEAARDNGIESVTKNMTNPDRYKFDQDGGNHFFGLRAGNNQEIATSRWFTSAENAKAGAARLNGTGTGTVIETKAFEGDTLIAANRDASISIAAAAPANPDAPKKKRKKRKTGPKKPKKEKVYLQDGSYPINNITYKIFRSSNDKHYFTFHKEDGKTLFLNADVRGFETEAQAKEMVDEVFKYGPIESNYEGKATRNGKYYFYIKGAEGKNIAKSFFYGTTDDMQKAVGLMLAGEGAIPAAAPEKPASTQDEYLDCDAYRGHPRSADNRDFVTFTHDGEFYFGMVDGDSKLRLRSEGYTSEAGRDNGIASVIKNRELEERWSVVEEDGKHYGILKAGNHQEIGRSCSYADAAGASWSWAGYSAGLAAASAAAAKLKAEQEAAAKAKADQEAAAAKAKAEKEAAEAAAKAKAEEEEAARLKAKKKYEEEEAERARLLAEEKAKREAEEAEKAKLAAKAKADNEAKMAAAAAATAAAAAAAKKSNLDEYLHCNEYKNKPKASTHKGFSTFKKDGQYYFALLDDNGNVRLRSQGYKNEAGRNNGMDSVVKNRGIESRWSVLDDGGKYYSILKAGNSQEIGRSCPYNDKGAAGWKWAAPVAAVAAVAAVPKKETPKKATPSPPKKKVVKEVQKKKVVAAAPVAASTGGGCMKYLWWLLPLLLLLLLLLWFLGCFGCDKTAAPIAPVVPAVEQTIIPADTIDTAAEEARLKAEADAKAEAARVQAAADEKARKMRERDARLNRGGNKNSGY